MRTLIEVRRRLDAGERPSHIARLMGLGYHTVYKISARITYRSVPWPGREEL